MGAVLTQFDNDGCERSISYTSQVFREREKEYSGIDKETLAIIMSIIKHNEYLYEKKFMKEQTIKHRKEYFQRK